jgi:hypothetical protein
MRHGLPLTALLVLASCGGDAEPHQETAADASDPVVVKLREGEAPDTLRNDKNPAWLAEIGRALEEDREWRTDADAFAAIVHYAKHAGENELPLIEKLLTDPKPERRMRGVLIVRLSPSKETLDLLEKHSAALLDPKDKQVAGVALGAAGHRRAKGTTEAILTYYEATEDPSALRALGRIWDDGKDDPLRTAVLLVAHAEAMSNAVDEGLAGEEATGAMLRVMTDPEVVEFLAKWAAEPFGARHHAVKVAGAKDFKAARGRRIHEALLRNPDAGVVSTILWRSPHKLDPELVKPLLDDERATPGGAKICDYAAARLEAMESGLSTELPSDEALRERRLRKWRGRR